MSLIQWIFVFVLSVPFFVGGWAAGERRLLGSRGIPALIFFIVAGVGGIAVFLTGQAERLFPSQPLRYAVVLAAAAFAFGYWDAEDLRSQPQRQISFLGQTFEMGCVLTALGLLAALGFGVLYFISRS